MKRNMKKETQSKRYMNIDDILKEIAGLSRSQGFYGRLYEGLMNTKLCDPENWKEVVKILEGQKFTSVLDIVLYFEQ